MPDLSREDFDQMVAIIERMNDCALGRAEMSEDEIDEAEAFLDKVLPPLPVEVVE